MPGVNAAGGGGHIPIKSDTETDVAGAAATGKQNAIDKKIDRNDNRSTTVGSAPGHAPAPPPKPSEEAKATSGGGEGYSAEDAKQKAIDEALKDLFASPEYREKWEQQESLAQLLGEFAGLEAKWGNGKNDGLMNWDDIKCAVLNRDRGTSKAELALADFLYENHDLFKSIDKDGDGMIDKSELKSMLRSLQSDLHTMESNTRSSAGSAATGTGPIDRTKLDESQANRSEQKGTNSDGKTQSIDELIKMTPFESTATDPGERMSDCVGHLQSEIDRLYASMTDQTSQADMSKIQGQIAKLQSMMQMVMSAMQQQQQMMSNIAKMWSDMAMNSIRNMK